MCSAVQSVLCGPCEVKSGFLWKAGEINTAWRRRWCVLTPTELKYYKKDVWDEWWRMVYSFDWLTGWLVD